MIDRFAVAIGIRVQATLAEGAQAVRTIETHQHRIERPVAIAQQIMPGHRIRSLAIEAEQAKQPAFRRAVTIRRIGNGPCLIIGLECVQYRALLVGGQQGGVESFTLVLLLRQQQIAMLDNRMPQRALYFAGQAIFAVETLALGGIWQCQVDQSVQWVVLIATEQGLIPVGYVHGEGLSVGAVCYPVSGRP